MFSFSIIFLSFVAVTGVIFIVHGLSKQPEDQSLDARQAVFTETDPNVPSRFDVPFIEKQLQKIQNSPSVVENYFTALRARFSLEKQIEILDTMQRYNNAVVGGIKSQTEMLEAERARRVAKNDLESVDEDIEIKGLERKVRKTELESKIQDFQRPQNSKPKTLLDDYEEQEQLKLLKDRIRRKYQTEREADNLRDRLSRRRVKEQVFKEEERIIREEVLKGQNIEHAGPEQLQELGRRLEDLQDLMDQVFDKE